MAQNCSFSRFAVFFIMVGSPAEGLVMRRFQHCGGGSVLKKEVATATSVVVVRVLSCFLPN